MSVKGKSKIPYIFIGFFAVIFLVNITYIYIAKKTWSGLVTEDSYQKGLKYNDTLKAVKEQKELGWKVNSSFIHKVAGSGEVEVFLKDEKSRIIKDATIYISFKRPSNEQSDFKRELNFIDGSYKTKAEFPLKGQWDFEMMIFIKGIKKFEQVERHLIKW